MNALTKAFVVLVTILSVLLVALVVPFVHNTENYKKAFEDKVRKVASLKALEKTRQAEITALQNRVTEDIVALNATIQNLQSAVNQLSEQLRDARTEADGLRAENARQQSDFSRLTASNEQQAQLLSALQSELRDRRSEMQEQQIRAIQLADRNNELQSQRDALETNLRRIKEQMVELEEKSAKIEGLFQQIPVELREQLFAAEEAEGPTEIVPDTPIAGQIMKVVDLQGETLVKVNVGANDGVLVNMKFLVHRGGQFLGTLIITTVAEQEAAGRIQMIQGSVQVSDEVVTPSTS